MILASSIAWTPLAVASGLLIAVAGGARWLIERIERRFDRLEDRVEKRTDALAAITSRHGRRLGRIEDRIGLSNGSGESWP